jgi:hypothetical protein
MDRGTKSRALHQQRFQSFHHSALNSAQTLMATGWGDSQANLGLNCLLSFLFQAQVRSNDNSKQMQMNLGTKS